MTFSVFRFYFFMFFIPTTMLLLEKLAPVLGYPFNLPKQYVTLIGLLYLASIVWTFISFLNGCWNKKEHLNMFGTEKYNFIWTWYIMAPGVVAFHQDNMVIFLGQLTMFLILEYTRNKHNKYSQEYKDAVLILRAKETKAERVEIE